MRLRRKLAVLFHLAVIAVLLSSCGSERQQFDGDTRPNPDQSAKLALLNEAAERLYKEANAGDPVRALEQIKHIEHIVQTTTFGGITSIEGIVAFTDAIVDAKRKFVAVNYSPQAGLFAAAKIRLAADALSHRKQAMWHQYDKLLKEDAALVERMAREQPARLKAAVHGLTMRYELVRPSLAISLEPYKVEMADSLIRFMTIESEGTKPNIANTASAAKRFQTLVDDLFSQPSNDVYLPIVEPVHPWVWTMTFGSIILAVLTYVGWLKYKFQPDYIVIQDENLPRRRHERRE